MERHSVSAAEFQRNFGRYQDEALKRPLSITRNGRERLVVLSVEEYQRLKRRDRVVFRTEALSEAEIKAIAEGGMDARHYGLDAELE
jgi:prevent-host-death family protein